MVVILALLPHGLDAQSPNEQLWFEYMINYAFANSYNLEGAFKYSTLLNTPRWQAFEFTPTLDYSLTAHVDISFATTIEYTDQTESVSTFEVRPVLGTRIHFTPHRPNINACPYQTGGTQHSESGYKGMGQRVEATVPRGNVDTHQQKILLQ